MYHLSAIKASNFFYFRTASDDYCLTEERCQIFIRQITRGLQYIHSKRIIHLDLKPFNVIFANPDDDYNLRIIDFGLAEQLKVMIRLSDIEKIQNNSTIISIR